MGVVVETQTEVTFVQVEVAGVYCVFLDVHGFIDKQLFETVVEFLFFEKVFKLLFEVHHGDGLEFDSQIVEIAVEMFQIGVEWFGMIDDERVGSKIVD